MGLPLIGHLARKGFAHLRHDSMLRSAARSRSAARPWADDAAALAALSEVVLVCVGYDRELRELLAGSKAASAIAAGRDLCGAEHRASEDGAGARRAVRAERHPRRRRDDVPRRQGGGRGDAPHLRRRRGRGGRAPAPVLGAFSSDIVHTGGVGSAQVAKAVNNLIMWACLVADHEGARARAALRGRRREAAPGAPHEQRGEQRARATGACRRWPGPKTTWRSWPRWRPTAASRLPQAGVTREICRIAQAASATSSKSTVADLARA